MQKMYKNKQLSLVVLFGIISTLETYLESRRPFLFEQSIKNFFECIHTNYLSLGLI
jgi:hypothetical protein